MSWISAIMRIMSDNSSLISFGFSERKISVSLETPIKWSSRRLSGWEYRLEECDVFSIFKFVICLNLCFDGFAVRLINLIVVNLYYSVRIHSDWHLFFKVFFICFNLY